MDVLEMTQDVIETRRKPYEEWVALKQPAAWLAAAGRALRGWAIGKEVTEADFDAALHDAGAVAIGVTTVG